MTYTPNFLWCQWGAEQRVKLPQTWEQGPPLALENYFLYSWLNLCYDCSTNNFDIVSLANNASFLAQKLTHLKWVNFLYNDIFLFLVNPYIIQGMFKLFLFLYWPETDEICQLLGPETDPLCQFLDQKWCWPIVTNSGDRKLQNVSVSGPLSYIYISSQ
jgi:hypothetical protein